MRWSYKLGRICDIDIYAHVTFFILLLWVLISKLWANFSLAASLISVASVIIVFAIVVLHELGHSLAAHRFGVRCHDITLYPIGGVAHLERIPERPREEILIAIAGPAVNLLLGALLIAIQLFIVPHLASYLSPLIVVILAELMWALIVTNVALLVFNLIPAFPMDGGRILRAALAHKLDYLRATEIAIKVGKYLALVFVAVGIMYDSMLVLIAFFIWFGGASELKVVQCREYLRNAGMEGLLNIARSDASTSSSPASSDIEAKA